MSSDPSTVASNARKRAARAQGRADDEAPSVDRQTMSMLRLRGVLDAMQRAGLAAPHLVALADRLAVGREVASDGALLNALPAADLVAANLTPAAFIAASAAPLRPVVVAFRRMGVGDPAGPIPSAAVDAGRAAGTMLAERLKALPDAEAITVIGDAFERGAVGACELAIVRALPAAYLRGKASCRHWSVFAQYRDA